MRTPKTYLLIFLFVIILIISCAAFYNFGEENGFKRAEKINLESTYNAGYAAGYQSVSQLYPDTEEYSRTVYITDHGACYHRKHCGSLYRSSNAVPLRTALARHYTACSRCNP